MFKGLGALGDMGKLMKQAQEMQEKMAALQEKIAEMEAEGTSGAGLVTATATAEGVVRRLSVDFSLLGAEAEREVLEDLIVAAVNDAVARAKEMGREEMAKATEGLGLPPGMKLPFG